MAPAAQVGSGVKAAKDQAQIVIAYDRLIRNTANVDYYIAHEKAYFGRTISVYGPRSATRISVPVAMEWHR